MTSNPHLMLFQLAPSIITGLLSLIPLLSIIAHHWMMAPIYIIAIFCIIVDRRSLRNPLLYYGVAILLYIGVTSLWSVDLAESARRWLQISAITAAGYILCCCTVPLRHVKWLYGGWIIAAVLLIFDNLTKGTLYLLIHPHSEWLFGSKLNQATSVLTLLFWPILAFYLPPARHVWLGLLWGVVVLLGTHSETTALAHFCGVFTLWLSQRLSTKALVWLSKGGLLVSTLGAPFLPWILRKIEWFDAPWMHPSLRHRFHIWQFCYDHIILKPFFGWGVDTPHILSKQETYDSAGFIVSALHPHHIALQVWFEFGLVGVALFLIIAFAWLDKIRESQLTKHEKSLYLSQFCTFYLIASSGYGMWQSWWLSTLVLMMFIFHHHRFLVRAAS